MTLTLLHDDEKGVFYDVKDYRRGRWLIERLERDEDVDEEVIARVYGARRPVIFVEGGVDEDLVAEKCLMKRT